MSSLKGKPCVLCGAPSTRVGEHIWPGWFLRDFRGQGPFETSKNGVPFTAKHKTAPLSVNGLPGVHVPMCEVCNSELDRRFEKPAKLIVEKLVTFEEPQEWPTLTQNEIADLAQWLLKVGLLSAHPAAVHDLPQVDRDPSYPRLDPFLDEWTSWMANGDDPPAGFSVFATRRSIDAPAGDPPLDGPARTIWLPHIIVDGDDLRYMVRRFGFRGIDVTIVWHPGWEIDHAQVNEKRAVRLWPHPACVDLATLPEVNPKELLVSDVDLGPLVTTRSNFEQLVRVPLSHETNTLDLMISSISDPS
ncbi:hypothetical protein [Microbacterium sp. KSW4-4]|uniref:hypothetical protein n=1 Tax=Microbacterium sp. KSW4-4 TaxID=2851651 RepID=UPI001FFD3ACA|nr:hypothetical protein [Microbacterium sp. KSW4-4]MCK2032200.1 hypothetical protein [Microbacterium sp. KSW4-4]